MKKLFLYTLFPILMLWGCKSDPCKGVVTYAKLDAQEFNYFFKVGTYWVYRDSADGITDSQVVCSYVYNQHFRDPGDTPHIYPAPHGGSTYCGPYYLDYINTQVLSFQNGILKDTLNFSAAGQYLSSSYVSGGIFEHIVGNGYTSGTTFFDLTWPRLGLENCCYAICQNGASIDTTGTWVYPVQAIVNTGPYTFQNVGLWAIQICDGGCPRFAYRTDLYVASHFGIVKMVQHQPGRDVRWDLINYHITN